MSDHTALLAGSPTVAHYFDHYGKTLPSRVWSRVLTEHGFSGFEEMYEEVDVSVDGTVNTFELFMWLGY